MPRCVFAVCFCQTALPWLPQAGHVGKVVVSTRVSARQAPHAFQGGSLPSMAITGGSGKRGCWQGSVDKTG